MKLIDLTPSNLKCGIFGGCPAIFKDTEGNYLIIGKKLNPNNLPPEIADSISDTEEVISIPAGYIEKMTKE